MLGEKPHVTPSAFWSSRWSRFHGLSPYAIQRSRARARSRERRRRAARLDDGDRCAARGLGEPRGHQRGGDAAADDEDVGLDRLHRARQARGADASGSGRRGASPSGRQVRRRDARAVGEIPGGGARRPVGQQRQRDVAGGQRRGEADRQARRASAASTSARRGASGSSANDATARAAREQVQPLELRAPARRRIGRQVADLRVAVAVHLLGDGLVAGDPRDEGVHRARAPGVAELARQHHLAERGERRAVEVDGARAAGRRGGRRRVRRVAVGARRIAARGRRAGREHARGHEEGAAVHRRRRVVRRVWHRSLAA